MLHRKLIIAGQEFCLAAGQCGKGPPTKYTEGCEGVTYMDSLTKQMYLCTKCENGVYTWEPFAAGSSTGQGGGTSFTTDETLILADGVLKVNTTNIAAADNTLPITSAGVFAQVGNIEVLLKTI